MAVKTITIDLDAYERLTMLKKGKESFSQVIKKYLPTAESTAGAFLERLDRGHVSDETLDNIEAEIARRGDSPIRAPKW